MDLGTLKHTTRVLPIVHPATGEEIGVDVTLVSVNDPRLDKIRKAINNKRLMLAQRNKSFTADEAEKNTDELTASAVIGWEWKGDVTFNGEKPAFSKENVLKVFAELRWFRAQIDEALNNEQNFFSASDSTLSKPSESTSVTK